MDLKDQIYKRVYKYKTANKEGFTQGEIDRLLAEFAQIDISKFNNALSNVTCIELNDEIILYRHDVYNAVICGIEKRGINGFEFD